MNISTEYCNYLINYDGGKEWSVRSSSRFRYEVKHFELHNEIKDIITAYCRDLLKLEISRVNVGVLKYKKDSFFARHMDRTPKYEFNIDFMYNINVRLNDDYKGGEFYLDDLPYHKPVGEIYHYKSSQYHEVKKVTEGVRYSAIFYIRERDVVSNLNKENLI